MIHRPLALSFTPTPSVVHILGTTKYSFVDVFVRVHVTIYLCVDHLFTDNHSVLLDIDLLKEGGC